MLALRKSARSDNEITGTILLKKRKEKKVANLY
jgi:hypothetical protein